MLPTISVKVIKATNSELPKELSLLELVGKNDLNVIDLWHTKCTKCPAAIEKINSFAEGFNSSAKVAFYTLALSQGPADIDTVDELVQDWENLNHIFVEEADKNTLKGALGYSAVPFYVVVNNEGKIVWSGEPKQIDLSKEIPNWLVASKSLTTTDPAATQQDGKISFDEDF